MIVGGSQLGKWGRGFGTMLGDLQFVTKPLDFGAPDEDGVITLTSAAYFVVANIDLQGARLAASAPVTLFGSGAEAVTITSTGLTGEPLLYTPTTIQLRTLSMSMPAGEVCVEVDSDGSAALDWFFVNFTGAGRAGNFRDINNFIGDTLGLLAGDGFHFFGTSNTVGFSDSIFVSGPGSYAVRFDAAAVNSRRFRLARCAVIAFGGGIGLEVQDANIALSEGYILENVNFSGGSTYLVGLDYLDDKARFIECRGITNSTRLGEMYWENNATATPIASAGQFVKAQGTSIPAPTNQRFSHSPGRLTYESALTQAFINSSSVTVTSGNNNQVAIAFFKNGTTQAGPAQVVTTNAAGRAENVTLQSTGELALGDYIEIFVANLTGTSAITVTFMDTIVRVVS